MENKTRFTLAFLFTFLFVIGLGSAASFNVTGNLEFKPDLNQLNSEIINGEITIKNINSSQNFTQVNITNPASELSFEKLELGELNSSKEVKVNFNISLKKDPKVYNYQFNISAKDNDENLVSEQFNIKVNVTEFHFVQIESKTISISENSTIIKVTNNGNIKLGNVLVSIPNSTLFSFEVSGPNSIEVGKSANYNIKITPTTLSSSRAGVFENRINLISDQVNGTGTLSISKDFCRAGKQGSLISFADIEDRSSGDEWNWEPLKNVKVRVNDVFNGAEASKTIRVRLALFDSNGRSIELSNEDRELEQSAKIKAGYDSDFNFEFTLPADLKEGRYSLFVKAYTNENDECFSDFQIVDIDVEEEVLIDELEIPSVLICGDPAQISFKLYNFDLGYSDEPMKVNLYSQNLGIDIDSHEFELDDGDSEFISFDFISPTKQTGSYKFSLTLDYDYRDSSDTFRKSKTLGTYTIRLEGNQCKIDDSNLPIISAALDEDTETKVGEDLVLLINVTNNGETGDIAVVIDGYTSWANLVTLSEPVVTLVNGETRTITATFTPTKSGKQEFTIKAILGGSIKERKVTVEIEEGERSLFKSIFGDVKFNLAFWLTIGIFIILILIIFVLFVKFVAASTSKE